MWDTLLFYIFLFSVLILLVCFLDWWEGRKARKQGFKQYNPWYRGKQL